MSVLAMTVVSVQDHPNADVLRIYRFDAPGVAGLVVIANEEHTYAVGDVVAVARVGAELDPRTTVRRVRMRGIDSFGTPLGLVDARPGEDLTDRYCKRSPSASEGVFAKWASIEQLHGLRFELQGRLEATGEPLPRVTYRAKIKVDGTNAAVHALPDGFAAQSRTRMLTPEEDNYGFAAWAHATEQLDWCASLHARMGRAVVHGEWCGTGIQKRTAISRVGRKVFAAFAVQLGDPSRETTRLVVDPERLRALLPEHPDVFVLPWHGEPTVLDFADAEGLRQAAQRIDAMVAEVEATDPWVAEVFGLQGLGEGVVLYPVEGVEFDDEGTADRDRYTALMWKAKGEEHRVNEQKRPAQLDAEVARGVEEFVALMVTPARLEQGLAQVAGGVMQMRHMGDLLKWVGQDVHEESAAELAAAGLEWKQVAKAVQKAALQWFRARASE